MNRPYTLATDERADRSLRTILRFLFESLLSNVEGVIEDADIEFLHDLRVANRRTRTVLSQVKNVLPSSVNDEFAPEFRWLGSLTGSGRDLDVALVEIDAFRQNPIPHSENLADLVSFLEAKRGNEYERVAAALRSTRFRSLVRGWREFLENPAVVDIEPPLASAPIIDVAGPRILKAHKRLRKRGAGIAADAPASLLHRLRIDGKKLRYLLEFFFDLYDSSLVTRFTKELKRFQNILGDFNDTEVQLALIRKFRQAHPPSAAVGATDRLVDLIADRQRELRAEFTDRFSAFASDDSRKLYKKTFKR
jgi:CHAD domain-containing protein